jgi:hypothetical protein
MKNPKQLEDVFYHTQELKTDLARFLLENNRNAMIVYACNSFNQKIELIEKIIKSYDNTNLKLLYNKINLMIIENPELHGVQINLKRACFISQYDRTKVGIIPYTI